MTQHVSSPHPVADSLLAFCTDASDLEISAIVEQKVNGNWFPLAFTLRALSSAASRYSVFYHELLAAYHAVRHFCTMIRGLWSTLYNDHCPLAHSIHRYTADLRTEVTGHNLEDVSLGLDVPALLCDRSCGQPAIQHQAFDIYFESSFSSRCHSHSMLGW